MSKNFKVRQQDFVIKGNALIEARYRLSLQEAQIVLWLLTQIRLEDEDFKPHKLNIIEFAKLLDLNPNSQYAKLQEITEKLMKRVLKIYDSETQKLLQVAWLSSAEYEYQKGYIILEFSPKLKPHLLQLRSQFTKINIVDTLKLKSVHAIRILELLLQYLSIGRREITIYELRAYCGIEENEYVNYFDLKRKIIERAKHEITSKTEYEIDYSEKKESRKIVAIEWHIKKKNLEEEALQKQIKVLDNELNYKFTLVQDLIAYGYSKSLASKLVRENTEAVIKNALSAVSLQLSRNKVKNPRAMLRTAIKEGWHPEVYRTRPEGKNTSIKYSMVQDQNLANNYNNRAAGQDFQRLSDFIPKFEKL